MANNNLNKIDKLKAFEGETVETRWDPKKIIIGVIVLAVFGMLGVMMLTGAGRQLEKNRSETLGIEGGVNKSVEDKEPSLPNRADVERIIRETQETISNITAENLTSSQAEIQKMIQDLEMLQGKKDARAVFCDLVCKDKQQ
jgi:hypothetical protein